MNWKLELNLSNIWFFARSFIVGDFVAKVKHALKLKTKTDYLKLS